MIQQIGVYANVADDGKFMDTWNCDFGSLAAECPAEPYVAFE